MFVGNVFTASKTRGGTLTVANFATIPLDRLHLLSADVFLCAGVQADMIPAIPLQLVNECLPNHLTLLVRELWIVQLDMHTGYESIVKRPDTVCCKE